MSSSNPPESDKELDTLRQKLQDDANAALTNFNNHEVDWFLRGSNIKRHSADEISDPKPQVEPKLINKESPKLVINSSSTIIENSNINSNNSTSSAVKELNEDSEKVTRSSANTFPVVNNDTSLRRTRSYSVGTNSNNNGFFSKLSLKFGKKKNEPKVIVKKPLNGSNSSKESSSSSKNPSSSSLLSSSSSSEINNHKLSRSISTPQYSTNTDDELDPRFEKFLDFYQHKNDPSSHLHSSQSTSNIPMTTPISTKPRTSSLSRLLSRSKVDTEDSYSETAYKPDDEIPESPKVDVLGRPIPPHPAEAPFPPAIRINKISIPETSESSSLSASSPISSGLIGNLLKRRQSADQSPGQRNQESSDSLTSSSDNLEEIPGFIENPPPLKRVTFSEKVFFNDPPQQIASRHPRKGEVEILKNGNILIHKLTAEERQKLLQEGGGGVVVGGFGHLKISIPEDKHVANEDNKPIEGETDAETAKLNKAKSIGIDKPMISRNKSTATLSTEGVSKESTDSINKLMSKKIPLDQLYTRCCHLREILPIKSTLKQIPKDSTQPLTQIQFKNPNPSLIEIVTFGDFISIAPIYSVVIDGISLSFEMLKILLASLTYKTDIKRLSFRNTCLDEQGWKLLCWFLVKNKSLNALDITMCESLTVLQTSKSTKIKPQAAGIVRMVSNKDNRSDMDWSLFTASLICRSGLESLVLTGCKIEKLTIFKKLFELGLKNTVKIGLAYNDLTYLQMEVISNWFYECAETIEALDLGFNNLRMTDPKDNDRNSFHLLLDSMARVRKEKKICNLKFFSLNSTEVVEDSNSITKDAELLESSGFVYALSKLPNLRYLDLSGNPDYFKDNLDIFTTFLTLFNKISRLNLEYNNFSTIAIIEICNALLSCKNIYYLSLMGNPLDNESYVAILGLIKKTKIISIELDYDTVPSKFKARIGIYTMRNMERVIYGDKKFTLGDDDDNDNNEVDDEEEVVSKEGFSLGSLTEEVITFLQNYEEKVEKGEELTNEDKSKMKEVLFKFLKTLKQIKTTLNESIDKLVQLQTNHKLSHDGKEALIRFCMTDNSVDKILKSLQLKHPQYMKEFIENNDGIINWKIDNFDKKEEANENGVNDGEIDEENDEAVPLSNIRSLNGSNGSNLNLKKLDQEEGSILKASSTIQNRVNFPELIKNTQNSETLLLDVPGEEIKQALLDTSNLNKIVNVLDTLKESGISLEDVFKKKDVQQQLKEEFANGINLHDSTLDEDHEHHKLLNHVKEENKDDTLSDLSDYEDSENEGFIAEEDAEEEKKEKDENKETFDTLVNDLVRVRSRV